MLNSRNRLDLWRGLIKISARASRDQANWAVDLFVANSSHPDDTVRIAALSGLGEMARVHGVTTQRAVDVARKAAAEDPSPVVRRYASKSVAEIARFCPSVGVE